MRSCQYKSERGVEESRDQLEWRYGGLLYHLLKDKSYTFLKVEQNTTHNTKIWRSQLTRKTKIRATNSLAAPVMTYTFGFIKWTLEALRIIDSNTRKILTVNNSHRPRSSVQRLYMPRLEHRYNRITTSIYLCIKFFSDPLLKIVLESEKGELERTEEKTAKEIRDEGKMWRP